MADITNEFERTSRLSVLDGTDYISTMLGTFIGAPLFKFFGYYAVFGTSGSLAFLGVIYAILVVKESLPEKSVEQLHIKELQQNNSPTTDYGTNVCAQYEDNSLDESNMIMVAPSRKDNESYNTYCCQNQSSCSRHIPNISDLVSSFEVIVRSRPGWNRAMVLM